MEKKSAEKIELSPVSNLKLDMTFHYVMFLLVIFHLSSVDNNRITFSNLKFIQAQGVPLFP